MSGLRVFVRSTVGPLEVSWPEGWPPPRVGDEIDVPGVPQAIEVHRVTWFPGGQPQPGRPDLAEPYVLVYVGLRRGRLGNW